MHLSTLRILFAKVSWVRHRDIHILTAGAYTYTSDQRFQAMHKQNVGLNSEWTEWTLCIKWAQERDQGIYECQISTIPIKSHQFRLNVVGESCAYSRDLIPYYHVFRVPRTRPTDKIRKPNRNDVIALHSVAESIRASVHLGKYSNRESRIALISSQRDTNRARYVRRLKFNEAI